jgi:hypothetical protein
MNPVIELENFEHESARFDSLMPYKVKNILLVSSLYDMYNLREDGQLANMLLSEYAELRWSSFSAHSAMLIHLHSATRPSCCAPIYQLFYSHFITVNWN